MRAKFLNTILGQRSKLEALRCLFAGREELTGREIARRTGLSHLIIHKALGELEAEGLVERRVALPTHQFKLNRKHWVTAEILAPLFEKEATWLNHLERFIKQGIPKAVVSVILFGSVVKGKLIPKSDIDVLVLVGDAREKEGVQVHFQKLGEKVYASFHHPLSVMVMSMMEFLEQHRSGKKFAKEISYSGRVVYGKLLTEVLVEHGTKKY